MMKNGDLGATTANFINHKKSLFTSHDERGCAANDYNYHTIVMYRFKMKLNIPSGTK